MSAQLLRDPHLWTAGAYCVIGLMLLAGALHIWWTHPVNRAFTFGPYLTEKGVRLVLRMLPLVWLFGLVIASCAVDHAAESMAMVGMVPWPVVHVLGLFEAVVSWITALSMVWLAVRSGWGLLWTRT